VEVIKHNDLTRAAAVIKSGGVLVYPTDTVWGLGCCALDQSAVERVIAAKDRPENAGLIWLLPSLRAVKKYFPNISRTEQKLLNKKRTTVIIENTAVRVVKTGWVNKFVAACGVPVVSTSANLHGQGVITSWRQAEAVFNGKVDAVVRGGKVYGGVPSTIAKVENGEVKILRAGGGIQ
jgi:L-threonylcarbamoyladenylate synthase